MPPEQPAARAPLVTLRRVEVPPAERAARLARAIAILVGAEPPATTEPPLPRKPEPPRVGICRSGEVAEGPLG
jgi:hypothetical protein